MDDCDITSDRMEKEEEARRRLAPAGMEAEPTGKCLWCDEPLDGGRRWCSRECMEDWGYHMGRRGEK